MCSGKTPPCFKCRLIVWPVSPLKNGLAETSFKPSCNCVMRIFFSVKISVLMSRENDFAQLFFLIILTFPSAV